MKIIVVSDWHIGLKKEGEAKMIKFLNSLEWNSIYYFIAVGDMIDLWAGDILNILKENKNLFQILRKIIEDHSQVKFYYVIGNHDFALKESLFGDLPFNFRVLYPDLEIKFNNEIYYFTHGHLESFEWKILGKKALKLYQNLEYKAEASLLGRLWYSKFVSKIRNFILKKFTSDAGNPYSSEYLKDRIFEKNYKFAFAGHTHIPLIESKNNKTYINIGDFVSNYSYVEIEDGIPSLKYFEKLKNGGDKK